MDWMADIILPDTLLFDVSDGEFLDSDANSSHRGSARAIQYCHGNVVLKRERHVNGCAIVTRIR